MNNKQTTKYTKRLLYIAFCTLLFVFSVGVLARTALAEMVVNAWLGYRLTSGLVSHYTFDGENIDLSLPTAEVRDVIGSNHGDWKEHATTTTLGKLGQALDFDGTDDYVELGTGLDINGEMTVSLWVSPDIIGAGVSEIIANNNALGNQQDYNLELNRTAGKLSSVWGSTVIITGNTTLSVNTWHHAVLVRSGSSGDWTAKIYLDGREDNSAATAVNPNGSNENTTIGRAGADPVAHFNGKIDDVRIYNRALSADEVRGLYRLGNSAVQNKTPRDRLTSGLVGHWTFDGKDMEPNVRDVSGSGNHGGLLGQTATTTVIGKIGQALDFDGVDDRVQIDASSFPTGDFTYSVWVKKNSASDVFVLSSNNDVGGISEIAINVNSDNTITFNADNSEFTTNETISLNVWTHVAYYRSGSSFRGYINGVLTSNSGTDGDALTPLCTLIIGADDDTTGCGASTINQYWDGYIDDVRIYNRALSADEIRQLYLMGGSFKQNVSPRSRLTSGLVGYWTFDGPNMDISAPTAEVKDISGNSLTGDWKEHATTTVPGKIGQAINFDLTNDYIDISDNALLDVSYFTLAAWVNKQVDNTEDAHIIARQSGTGVEDTFVLFYNNDVTTRDYYCGARTSGGIEWVDSNVSGAADMGVWVHIACTYDGTTIRIYRNGALVESNTHDFGGPVVAETTKLTIGANYSGPGRDAGIAGFAGALIDEVRIYNRALSADEVIQLYLMGK